MIGIPFQHGDFKDGKHCILVNPTADAPLRSSAFRAMGAQRSPCSRSPGRRKDRDQWVKQKPRVENGMSLGETRM